VLVLTTSHVTMVGRIMVTFIYSTGFWSQVPAPLHCDHDSPYMKRLRSSFVFMKSAITNLVLGQKKPSRNVGGTQNKSSEFGPNIQPSCITKLSVNGVIGVTCLK
jgi:hypothetical protein